MVRNANNSDQKKEEFEISNTEVVEIIRLQVFDPLASEVKKLLKEKCNVSLVEYEKPGWERSSRQSIESGKTSYWPADGSKICSGTVPQIGPTRWHSATCWAFQHHDEHKFQENAGIRMAQCQNLRNINGTVPIEILWIAEFKSSANMVYDMIDTHLLSGFIAVIKSARIDFILLFPLF